MPDPPCRRAMPPPPRAIHLPRAFDAAESIRRYRLIDFLTRYASACAMHATMRHELRAITPLIFSPLRHVYAPDDEQLCRRAARFHFIAILMLTRGCRYWQLSLSRDFAARRFFLLIFCDVRHMRCAMPPPPLSLPPRAMPRYV